NYRPAILYFIRDKTRVIQHIDPYQTNGRTKGFFMAFVDEAERLLRDPLLPLDVLARQWDVTPKFLFREEKRGRLQILRLSRKVCRVRASEALRYEREATDAAA